MTALVIARIRPMEWLGLKWREWYLGFAIVPVVIVAMYAFLFGLDYLGYKGWIESLGAESMQDTVKLLQESDDLVVIGLMAVAAVIAAPLCEEIVFRGYLYGAAKKFAGPWMAGICSAMVFAAAHGSLAALLPLFVFGCVLVLLYEMTGSIWAPVAAHFCFNGLTVLLQVGARIFDLSGPTS
ncbi:MAG: CPBP family intramembrane metalloprotease [Verrucomicrobiaceae bacterium]|nr:MAG: CPBP family intramembrane metalloprotease [Verrucomicrobiaceae bacterium]